MTPEERVRMNKLCAEIQDEKDYGKFVTMVHEISELIGRKEKRRFSQQPEVVWVRNKPWIRMGARVTKLVPSVDGPNSKMEISIPPADDLFREVRIDNRLLAVDGTPVSIIAGTELSVTIEAGQNALESEEN